MLQICVAKAEIKKFQGVQLCQDEPVLSTPPPAPSACLCVFDVDRTLTGKQGLADGTQCAGNKIVDGVWDSAYGGGTLTLSQAAQGLNRSLRLSGLSYVLFSLYLFLSLWRPLRHL